MSTWITDSKAVGCSALITILINLFCGLCIIVLWSLQVVWSVIAIDIVFTVDLAGNSIAEDAVRKDVKVGIIEIGNDITAVDNQLLFGPLDRNLTIGEIGNTQIGISA